MVTSHPGYGEGVMPEMAGYLCFMIDHHNDRNAQKHKQKHSNDNVYCAWVDQYIHIMNPLHSSV